MFGARHGWQNPTSFVASQPKNLPLLWTLPNHRYRIPFSQTSNLNSPRFQSISSFQLDQLFLMHGMISQNLLACRLTVWNIERRIFDRISKYFAFPWDQRKLKVLVVGLVKASKLNIPSSALSPTVVAELNKEVDRVTGLTQKMGYKLLTRALSDVVSGSTFRKLAR